MSKVSLRGERGSATLFTIGVVGVLALVGAALGVAGAMVHAHRVAQSAADLAALAGAHSLTEGGDACAAATAIAEANGATVDGCEVDGLDVRLQVTVPGPRWLGQRHDLSALARAGSVARLTPSAPGGSDRGGQVGGRTSPQEVRSTHPAPTRCQAGWTCCA